MVLLGGLLLQGVVERYSVIRACQVVVRYGKGLPQLVISKYLSVDLCGWGVGS